MESDAASSGAGADEWHGDPHVIDSTLLPLILSPHTQGRGRGERPKKAVATPSAASRPTSLLPAARAGWGGSSQQLEQAGEAPPMASWSRPLLPAARARWGCSSRWRQWAARDCSSRHDGEQVRVALARAAWRECAMAASRCVASKCAMAVRPFGEQIERTRRRSSREGPQIPYARTG